MEKKQILVNLNFDDFHPQTDAWGDFGGNLERGVFRYVSQLWDEFPGLVVTMFTTPNWIDRPSRISSPYYHIRRLLGLRPVVAHAEGEPYRLDKHPEWCAAVRGYVAAGKMEVAVHGYYHYNPDTVIHGQEFIGLDHAASLDRIRRAEELFAQCGIPFTKGFRPPGWGMSAGLVRALHDMQYHFVGFSGTPRKLVVPEWIAGMLNVPQNYSIKEAFEEAVRQAEKHGIVFMKGHMCYQHGRETIENGLNDRHFQNARTALRLLHEKFDVRYASLGEYAKTQAIPGVSKAS